MLRHPYDTQHTYQTHTTNTHTNTHKYVCLNNVAVGLHDIQYNLPVMYTNMLLRSSDNNLLDLGTLLSSLPSNSYNITMRQHCHLTSENTNKILHCNLIKECITSIFKLIISILHNLGNQLPHHPHKC